MLLDVLLSLKSPSAWVPITLTYQLSKFTATEISVGFYILYILKNKELKSELKNCKLRHLMRHTQHLISICSHRNSRRGSFIA